jgi:hypothetical protein
MVDSPLLVVVMVGGGMVFDVLHEGQQKRVEQLVEVVKEEGHKDSNCLSASCHGRSRAG